MQRPVDHGFDAVDPTGGSDHYSHAMASTFILTSWPGHMYCIPRIGRNKK